MTEHTHLSGIEVNGDSIKFSFAQHESVNDQAVAGMEVPADANPDRLGAQLKALADANAITHDQAQTVAEHSGLGDKLYTPEPKKAEKDEIAADAGGNRDVVGDKTAAYLAKQAQQADAGMSI